VSDAQRAGARPELLEGNGVGLLRERALATAIQGGLERLYQLDRIADVDAFVAQAEAGEREALLVRMGDDGAVEMSLRLPLLGRAAFDVLSDESLDPLCQIIEGVSHFVYLASRAKEDRRTTQLELELQAEVDKYVVLVAALGALDEPTSARLRGRLYEEVSFADAAGTELGERYRIANQVAARFVRRLETTYLRGGRVRELHGELRRFYRLGQEDKLRVAG
jgi:hypothetical protein